MEFARPRKPVFQTAPESGGVSKLPGSLLAPVPLFLIQPALGKIARHIARKHPEIFERIGEHAAKQLIIDPVNLPFALVLRPHPERPELRACRRRRMPRCEARISATCLTFLNMIDGHLDGDALFFTRNLAIQGDTEIVVALRNALDDVEGSIADDAAAVFGTPGQYLLSVLRKIAGSEYD